MKQGFYVHVERTGINIYEVSYTETSKDELVHISTATSILNESSFHSLYVKTDMLFDDVRSAVNAVYRSLTERLIELTEDIQTVTHILTTLRIGSENYLERNKHV